MKEELRSALNKLGAGEYKDGSSTKPGWLYQPMADFFPELLGVRVHTKDAVRRTFRVIDANCNHSGALIDIGCATGYYLAGLHGYEDRYGVDADENSVELGRRLGLNCFQSLDIEAVVERCPRPVTVLALNVHMWWHKQGIDEVSMNLAANCLKFPGDEFFFQTAGRNSGGRYRVMNFGTVDDEREYLWRWFSDVEHLDTNTEHGGVRHLWKCSTRAAS